MKDSNLYIFDKSIEYKSLYSYSFLHYFNSIDFFSNLDQNFFPPSSSFIILDYSIFSYIDHPLLVTKFSKCFPFISYNNKDFKSSYFVLPPYFYGYFLKPFDFEYILNAFQYIYEQNF